MRPAVVPLPSLSRAWNPVSRNPLPTPYGFSLTKLMNDKIHLLARERKIAMYTDEPG